MSRPKLIKNLKIKHPSLKTPQIENFIDNFFNCVLNSLKEKNSVEIRGFGTFFVREIKEKYSARNPKTGELIYVPKKNRIRFKTSKKFKEFINK